MATQFSLLDSWKINNRQINVIAEALASHYNYLDHLIRSAEEEGVNTKVVDALVTRLTELVTVINDLRDAEQSSVTKKSNSLRKKNGVSTTLK